MKVTVTICVVGCKFKDEADLSGSAIHSTWQLEDPNSAIHRTEASPDHRWGSIFKFELDQEDAISVKFWRGHQQILDETSITLQRICRKKGGYKFPEIYREFEIYSSGECVGHLGCDIHVAWPSNWRTKDKKRWVAGLPEAVLDTDSAQLRQAKQALANIECHQAFIDDLVWLSCFDIVMICDDSSSMDTKTEHGTRWTELTDNVKGLVNLCGALDEDGVDLIFLNRTNPASRDPNQPRLFPKIKNLKQVVDLFGKSPYGGGTDLATAMRAALALKKHEKPMLIILATDGQPNSLSDFRTAIVSRPEDVFLTLLACSNNEKDVAYLNELDQVCKRVDTLDDYESEKAEVERAQEGQLAYTKGDHIARMLLGPVFKKYDKLDERLLNCWN